VDAELYPVECTRADTQIAAEPYETIAFAIPSKELVEPEEDEESIWEHWDPDEKVYSCQILYR
jgi:splicing factor 3A subunit 2